MRVGLVMLVPVVLDHSVAAYADVRTRDLHPSQGDPGVRDSRAGVGTRMGEEPRLVCAHHPHPIDSPPPAHSPVEDVVILTTPAPVLVGEAIDSQELGFIQARHTSEVAGIGQPGTRKTCVNEGPEGIPDRGLATRGGRGLGVMAGAGLGRPGSSREGSPHRKPNLSMAMAKWRGWSPQRYRLRSSMGTRSTSLKMKQL